MFRIKVIHPSIHHLYTLCVRRLILCRVAGGLEPIPADLGRRQGTPWTGRQSIAGRIKVIIHEKSSFLFSLCLIELFKHEALSFTWRLFYSTFIKIHSVFATFFYLLSVWFDDDITTCEAQLYTVIHLDYCNAQYCELFSCKDAK